MAKPNHMRRLPVGCKMTVQRVEDQATDGDTIQRWTGVLGADWMGKHVQVGTSTASLLGVITQLAKAWSKQCPNSDMRRRFKGTTHGN